MNDQIHKDNTNLNSLSNEKWGIIYNITIKVEQEIAEAWLQWLLNEHIPSIMKTNCFENYRVVRLLDVDDSEGPTYAVQYHANSKADYNRYIQLHAVRTQKQALEKWGQQFITFNSVMEVVK